MRRHVESAPKASPVDAHERTRDYLSEEEFAVLLQGAPHSRYRWRNAAMLMRTFYHGLRVTELCRVGDPLPLMPTAQPKPKLEGTVRNACCGHAVPLRTKT